MRVLCRHGHFAFFPRTAGDIAAFMNYHDIELERDGDFYTFPLLNGAPDFSIVGSPYLNLPATKTYEGHPWEVMRENGFVYSIALGALVPKESVTILMDLPLVKYYFVAPADFIQPGSQDRSGQKILSYDAEYRQDFRQLRVSEFQYE